MRRARFASSSSLSGRGRSFGRGSIRGCSSSKFPAFFGWCLIHWLAHSGAAFLSATRHLVNSGPCTSLGLVFGGAARFISLFDMFGLAFLFVAVLRFTASWHGQFPPATKW